MIFVRRQAQSLVSQGIDVRLFYLGSRTAPRALLREMRRFRAELTSLRPDVVHAQFGTVTALFAALASERLPLVITYRGSDLNPPPASYLWPAKVRAALGRCCSQLAALRAQRTICVSEQLRRRLWWRRSRAVVLPTGVDSESFSPRSRAAARRRLGWNGAERVVLFNAGHDPLVKRLDLAQAAVEEARRRLPGLHLEILNGRVPPELLPDMMNAADCLLLSSASEGSPTVVQEALASNLPVVSVDVGDVAERLRDVCASTVAAGSAGVLGRALASILEPPRRSNGRLKIAEFCARRIAMKLRDIYEELAARSNGRQEPDRAPMPMTSPDETRWAEGGQMHSGAVKN
jgi:glycosyltransferase involved in cell wall biosynthesis